ncbi:MAG: TetR/AcrR family transcriptional regulator [Acidimicrobiia bacterium]
MSTRDRIVAAAAQLYGRYGYTGVGLKQVAAESGSPIGSLYHFFPGGKEELAAAALRMSGAGYQTLVEGILENMPDLPSGIEQSFAIAAEVVSSSGYVDACWIETVALEVASTSEPLRMVTAEIFEGWIDSCAAWVESHGVQPEKARELGIAYITGLEGAFILARSLRSPEPLLATGRMLAAAAREALAAPPRKSVKAKGARR